MQQLKASPGLQPAAAPAELAHAPADAHAHRFPHRQRPAERRRPATCSSAIPSTSSASSPRREQTDAFLHPDAIRLLRRSLRLIDDKLRNDPEANRIFLELLTGDTNPEPTLRRMNEAGVLGRFMPRVRPRRRHDAVQHVPPLHGRRASDPHRRHADRHRARRAPATQLPLSTEIFNTIKNRRALYVAAFLHDIGKGRDRGSLDRRRAHRARAVPAPRPDAGRDRDGRLADRAASDDEQHRPEPRHLPTPRPSATSPTSCRARSG